MSLQTSIPAILLHALIFSFIYTAVTHCYWHWIKKHKEMKWHNLVKDMEQQVINEQINQMYLNQYEQTEVLKELASKCTSEKVVCEKGPDSKPPSQNNYSF